MVTRTLLLLLQDHHRHNLFNLFTFSFPVLLICIFLTWAASSTSIPPESPSSSAVAASNFLSSRGYSLFASAILSPSFNATGTVLAPPDFSLSIAAKSYLHGPPRASLSILLYHTLKVPLSWQQISEIADNSELRTLSGEYCLFLSKKSNGDISITGSRKRILSVKIRQPDLYVSDQLTVHGIDGVLDLNTAAKCSLVDPTVRIKSHVDRMYLDHAIRALKKRGFTVVATAMAIKRRDLMDLTGVTVFATSDATLFSETNGFRYDFSHHVVPKRMRMSGLSRVPAGTVMETMAPNKTIVIGEFDLRIMVNGIEVNVTEVYHNRWIVVISVLRSLDDTAGLSDSTIDQIPSPAPISTGGSQVCSPSPSISAGVQLIPPDHSPVESPDSGSVGVPSQAPISSRVAENITANLSPVSESVVDNQSTGMWSQSPSTGEAQNLVGGPAPANSLPLSSSEESASAPANPLPLSSSEESASAPVNPLPPSTTEESVSTPANSLPFSSTDESAFTPANTLPVSSTEETVSTPANSLSFTATDEYPPVDDRCSMGVSDGGDSAVFLAVEGEELFCPINARKQLEERKSADVDLSLPSDLHSSQKENQSEPLITLVEPSNSKHDEDDKKVSRRDDYISMADDLFFYN